MRRLSLLEACNSYRPRGSAFDASRFSLYDDAPAECETFLPAGFEPNYAYPVVVWLHGAGSDERELSTVMPLVSDRNFVAVAPRGPIVRGRGYAWGSPSKPFETLDRIHEAVDRIASECNVARDRVFVAGAHEAGELALRVALASPGDFAGAAALLGRFPRTGTPLGRWLESRDLPMFLTRCEHSSRYDDEAFAEDLRMLHSAGMKLHVAQFPAGDDLTTTMFDELNGWMMSRIATAVTG